MQAGKLDRVIGIQRATTGISLAGDPIRMWTTFATMRAQLLAFTTDNREGQRDTTDTTVGFRMRWLDGVGLESRVLYDGQAYTIRQIKEIGRHVGLDLTCERVGP